MPRASSRRINGASTVEAANLRRRADDDVAAVREWSKAEMARCEPNRGEIGQRKTALEGESTPMPRSSRLASSGSGEGRDIEPRWMTSSVASLPNTIGRASRRWRADARATEPARGRGIGLRARGHSVHAGAAPEALRPPRPAPERGSCRRSRFRRGGGRGGSVQRGPRQRRRPGSRRQRGLLEADVTAAYTGPGPASEAATTQVTTRVVVVGLISVASIAAFSASSVGRWRRRHRGRLRPGRRVRLQRDAR